MKLSILSSAVVLCFAAVSSNAADVTYSGTNCARALPTQSETLNGSGASMNMSGFHQYVCPFEHSGGDITNIFVRVIDDSSQEDVECQATLIRRNSSSIVTLESAERATTNRNSATETSLSLGGISGNNRRFAGEVNCFVPEQQPGANPGAQLSGIASYRIVEED